MTVAVDQKNWTDEAFLALPEANGPYELVNGEVIAIGNSGVEHGNIGLFLGGAIEFYVRPRKLGLQRSNYQWSSFQESNKGL